MKLMRELSETEIMEVAVAVECLDANGKLDPLKFAAALFLKASIRFGQPLVQHYGR